MVIYIVDLQQRNPSLFLYDVYIFNKLNFLFFCSKNWTQFVVVVVVVVEATKKKFKLVGDDVLLLLMLF